jgi:glucoside 3-dehydrogenase (cytochrome c) hitch-hiker subunit
MDRREVVRLLTGVLVVPTLSGYSAEELLALGRRLNARITEGGRGPNLFDPHQRSTVSAIAERIIPATDTAGARAARVPEFIELIVAEHYTEDERIRFLAGLTDVDARCRAAVGRDFIETSPVEQDRILGVLEAKAEPALAQKPPEKKPIEPSQKPEEKPAEKPREARQETPVEQPDSFWRQIKFLTIYGYYTSEIGVIRELHTVVIPGRYDPCAATGVGTPGGS